ncbi:MAG: phytoene/squalene synthase family protein [Planctomycetota bacterium]|nr:phytoene/squalene synthase family protein [Planctomycetota bacterium]
MHASRDLDRLLRGVSRSFYLTLRVAPRPLRRQLAVAYLFCRAADTIADTRLLPPAERLEHLDLFREQFARDEASGEALRRIARRLGEPGAIPQERELLERLAECFAAYDAFDEADRALIRQLVTTLTRGMAMDLERFPPEESGRVVALESDADLDRYCYHVAGCVGEFWTDLSCAHLAALKHWDVDAFRARGVRFGKGLQMTNVLRDVDRDLAIGRLYLPASRLLELGLSPEELQGAAERRALRPVVHDLLRLTVDHYRAGWEYTLAIPRRLFTLRLACVWPLWIGLRTLALLARSRDPCAPGVVLKISRPDVRRVQLSSLLKGASNRQLDRVYRRLEREVEQNLERRKLGTAS